MSKQTDYRERWENEGEALEELTDDPIEKALTSLRNKSTPEGVPDDADYLPPNEDPPEDGSVHESGHGGRYVTFPEDEPTSQVDAPDVDEEAVREQLSSYVENGSFDSVGEQAHKEEVEQALDTLESDGLDQLNHREALVAARALDGDESVRVRRYGDDIERVAREQLVEDIDVGEEFDGFEPYVVGGAVRDHFLGLDADEIEDYDLMAVPRPEEVGDPIEVLEERMEFVDAESAFPVFLDSEGREVALPRTEKSTGPGFSDFEAQVVDPDTSVDDAVLTDLSRRDQTIGASAVNLRDAELEDPYDGKEATIDRVIEPTTEAFQEDPVRVMRAARFAPRFDFDVDESIKEMAAEMQEGLEGLPDERAVQELTKTLRQAEDAGRFFTLLDEFNSLESTFPEVAGSLESVRQSLQAVGVVTSDTEVNMAGLGAGLGDDDAQEFADNHTISNDQETALLLGAELKDIEDFNSVDAINLAERIDDGRVFGTDKVGELVTGLFDEEFGMQVERDLEDAIEVINNIGGQEVMEERGINPQDIGDEVDPQEFRELIQEARLEALAQKAVPSEPNIDVSNIVRKDWLPYVGPKGGTGWINPEADTVSYDEDPPGELAVDQLSSEERQEIRQSFEEEGESADEYLYEDGEVVPLEERFEGEEILVNTDQGWKSVEITELNTDSEHGYDVAYKNTFDEQVGLSEEEYRKASKAVGSIPESVENEIGTVKTSKRVVVDGWAQIAPAPSKSEDVTIKEVENGMIKTSGDGAFLLDEEYGPLVEWTTMKEGETYIHPEYGEIEFTGETGDRGYNDYEYETEGGESVTVMPSEKGETVYKQVDLSLPEPEFHLDSFSEEDQETLERTVEGVIENHPVGISQVIDYIPGSSRLNADPIALYNLDSSHVAFNSDEMDTENLEKWAEKMYEEGFLAGDDFEHVAMHETFHAVHAQEGERVSPSEWEEYDEKSEVSELVSDYAGASPGELVAELGALMLKGVDVEAEMPRAYEIYRKYGGPPQEEVEPL